MPGTVIEMFVGEGDPIHLGRERLVMETMKMQHVIAVEWSGAGGSGASWAAPARGGGGRTRWLIFRPHWHSSSAGSCCPLRRRGSELRARAVRAAGTVLHPFRPEEPLAAAPPIGTMVRNVLIALLVALVLGFLATRRRRVWDKSQVVTGPLRDPDPETVL